MNTYKFYLGYTHTIAGKLGKVIGSSAKSDACASGMASAHFHKVEHANLGVLVRCEDSKETIVGEIEPPKTFCPHYPCASTSSSAIASEHSCRG